MSEQEKRLMQAIQIMIDYLLHLESQTDGWNESNADSSLENVTVVNRARLAAELPETEHTRDPVAKIEHD